jgi:hypothetical protein
MNYLNNSNYLGNYPYNYVNQYVPQPQPQQFISQPMAPQTQQPQSLNGKIVDSEDVVKATEVPIGGYGIFPKADLSEIYIKSWNNNGTTSIITFKPIIQEVKEPQIVEDNSLKIIERLNALDAKIDSLMMNNVAVTAQVAKKEVKGSDY